MPAPAVTPQRRAGWQPVAAALLLAFGGWLLGSVQRPADRSMAEIAVFADGAGEVWAVVVDEPETMTAGTVANLAARLQPAQADHPGNAPGLVIAGWGQGEWQVEARLDLPAAQVDPPGTIQARLRPEGSAFAWQVRMPAPGTAEGTLWVYVSQSGQDRQVVLARPIQVQARSVLGLTAGRARWVAGLCLAVGAWLALRSLFVGSRRGLPLG